jgi:hypothetical protein
MIACIPRKFALLVGIALAMNHVKGGILMKLSQKRSMFSTNFARLILFARLHGYYPSIDDVKARDGHMKNSLHYDGLAGDLILYDKDWNYLTETEDYDLLGKFWETLHPNCIWGGHFQDGNHFSMSWDKRR